MLKVRRSEHNGSITFALSGRIEESHVPELQKLFESEPEDANVTLDLEEVRLVDREVVRFLAACKARGLKLENCPSYVREWIETGSDIAHEH